MNEPPRGAGRCGKSGAGASGAGAIATKPPGRVGALSVTDPVCGVGPGAKTGALACDVEPTACRGPDGCHEGTKLSCDEPELACVE